METGLHVIVHFCAKFQTVHQKVCFLRKITGLGTLHHILNPHYPVSEKSRVALLLETEHKFHLVISILPVKVSKNICCRCSGCINMFQNIIGCMALDLNTCYWRISAADTGKDHPEIVVDLGACGNCRARIARIDLLFYGNCRRNSLNKLHIRLGHTSEELPRIRRKAFCKTALTLCIESIESQGRFSRSRNTGHNHELATRNLHCDILKVIDLRSTNYDISFFCHIQNDYRPGEIHRAYKFTKFYSEIKLIKVLL